MSAAALLAAEEAAVAGPSAPTTAFATMAAAQHVRPLADKARAAEQMAAQAHARRSALRGGVFLISRASHL